MWAMPAQNARKPIALTPVPVNGNVAFAPTDLLNEAVPPLQFRLRLPWNHAAGWPAAATPAVYVTAGSMLSNRVTGADSNVPCETSTITGGESVMLPAVSRASAV